MSSDNTKVALITGAARRIGATTAETLHANGYNVVIHYSRSADEANALVDKLNTLRPNSAASLCCELGDTPALETLANDAASCWGRLDLLVNNASSFFPTKVGEITPDDWDNLVNSNMKGPLFLSQAANHFLQKNGGAIINIVDIHAERPLAQHTVYCMAKAALKMMTLSLAKELAPKVRVNGVSPGAILWPENEAELSEEAKTGIINHVPLARAGEPQDIADAVLFLAEAPYVTGQIIAVDGGRSLGSASGV